jgi:hypothetical protein
VEDTCKRSPRHTPGSQIEGAKKKHEVIKREVIRRVSWERKVQQGRKHVQPEDFGVKLKKGQFSFSTMKFYLFQC